MHVSLENNVIQTSVKQEVDIYIIPKIQSHVKMAFEYYSNDLLLIPSLYFQNANRKSVQFFHMLIKVFMFTCKQANSSPLLVLLLG